MPTETQQTEQPAAQEAPATEAKPFNGIKGFDPAVFQKLLDAEQTEEAPAETAAEAEPGEAAPEPPADEPKTEEKPKEKDPLADRFTLLQRHERRNREERQRLEADRKAIAEERAKALAELEALKKDPLGTLKKFGITYDQLTDQVVSGKKPEPPPDETPRERALREQMEELRAWKTQQEQTLAEQHRQAQRHGLTSAIKSHVEEAGDRWEAIRTLENYEDVMAALDGHKADLGRDLTVEDVESVLEATEQVLRENKAKEWAKLQNAKFLATLRANSATQKAAGTPSGTRGKTLTSAAVAPSARVNKPLTDEERRREAARILAKSAGE